MNILFIYPEIQNRVRGHTGRYCEGIAALSAILRKHNHQVSLIHMTRRLSDYEFIQKLKMANPQLIGFSCNTHSYPYVEHYAGLIKENLNIPIICGGIHATLMPAQVMANRYIDFVCVGEGEEALVELVDALSNRSCVDGIPNIWVKNGTDIIRNNPRSLLDSDNIPMPDREIFDFKNLVDSRECKADILASRGCLYSCNYCCNQALRQIFSGTSKFVRFKKIENLINELKQLIDNYSFIRYISFEDDNLVVDRFWFRQFAEEYPRYIGLPYGCNINPEFLDEDNIKLLKESNCKVVYLGLESGNEFILRFMLNRHVSRSSLVENTHLLRRNNIKIITYNMVGLPFENSRMMLETIKINTELKPYKTKRSIFYPYPGTKLFDMCQKEGLLVDKKFDTYLEGSVLNLSRNEQENIRFFHRYFDLLVRSYAHLKKSSILENTLDKILIFNFLPKAMLVKAYDLMYSVIGFLYLNFVIRFYSRYKNKYC